MSPDPKAEQERDDFDYDPPRSIFAATWFRALLVLIVVGIVGAVAAPYALDWMNPSSPLESTAAVQSAPLPVAPPPGPGQAPASEDGASTGQGAPVGAVVATAPVADPVPGAAPSGEAVAPTPVTPAQPPRAEAPTSTARSETATASAPPAPKPASAPRAVAQASAGSGRAWWVQVGAFKDARTAERVAERLRAENFQVQESTVTRTAAAARPGAPASRGGSATEQYDVFVTGVPAPELTGRLTTKGLASEPSGSGVVVRPSLPLRDAVALSKDLAAEGLKVQVRRAGGDAGVAPSAAPAPAGTHETLHRVRVGSFADRAAAAAAMQELESKGFKGFLARGGS